MKRMSMMSTIENQNTVPILILGPRGSGKTTFLYKTYFKYATDNVNITNIQKKKHVLI